MLARVRIQTGVSQTQSLHRLTGQNVRLDNLIHIRFGNPAVPDCLGVDDYVGAMLALVETPGLVRAHAAFQSTFGEFLLEEFLQTSFGCWIAASPGMPCRALVSADEDVSFELWHQATATRTFLSILL